MKLRNNKSLIGTGLLHLKYLISFESTSLMGARYTRMYSQPLSLLVFPVGAIPFRIKWAKLIIHGLKRN